MSHQHSRILCLNSVHLEALHAKGKLLPLGTQHSAHGALTLQTLLYCLKSAVLSKRRKGVIILGMCHAVSPACVIDCGHQEKAELPVCTGTRNSRYGTQCVSSLPSDGCASHNFRLKEQDMQGFRPSVMKVQVSPLGKSLRGAERDTGQG